MDSRLKNLRWDTKKANAADAVRHGTVAGRRAKLNPDLVRLIRQRRTEGLTNRQIANQLGLNFWTVAAAATGRHWSAVE